MIERLVSIVVHIGIVLTFQNAISGEKQMTKSSVTVQNSKPVVIWWTAQLFPHWDSSKESVISCKLGDCIATVPSSNYLKNTEKPQLLAYIFYGSSLEPDSLPLPRLEHHLWALLHEESPMNNYILSHSRMIGLFNYTATFRRESDYPLTTIFLPNLEYLSGRNPRQLTEKNRLRKTLAPVLYVQSHCDVASDRDSYVAQLAKYIAIDSYGKCLNNRSLPQHLQSTETFQSGEFLNFIAQYKFHLAFENAICTDYVTEKLFRAWHVGSLPIYRGSPTIKDWAPNDLSLIVADDFETPKDLAEFVINIDKNDDLYEKYLEFKKPNGISNLFLMSQLEKRDWGVLDNKKLDFIRGFECFICDRLIESQMFSENDTSSSGSSKSADDSHMGCPPPQPSVNIASMSSLEKENLMDWISNYWYSNSVANALHSIIQTNGSSLSKIYDIALNFRDEL